MFNNLFPIAYLDAPSVLSATVTNIPGAGSMPVQVVANIGFRASYAIDFIDSTGDFIGVYFGPIGQEKLSSIIGGGVVNRSYGVIPALSRVSFRSMTSTAITNGSITATFMGYGGPPGSILP